MSQFGDKERELLHQTEPVRAFEMQFNQNLEQGLERVLKKLDKRETQLKTIQSQVSSLEEKIKSQASSSTGVLAEKHRLALDDRKQGLKDTLDKVLVQLEQLGVKNCQMALLARKFDNTNEGVSAMTAMLGTIASKYEYQMLECALQQGTLRDEIKRREEEAKQHLLLIADKEALLHDVAQSKHQLSLKINQLETELKLKEELIETQMIQINSDETKLTQMNEDMNVLSSKLNEMKVEINNKIEAIGKLSPELSSLKESRGHPETLREQQQHDGHLEAKLSDADDQVVVDKPRQEVADLKQQLQSKKHEYKELDDEFNEALEHYEKREAGYVASLGEMPSKILDLTKENHKYKTEINLVTKKLQRLEHKFELFKNEKIDLEKNYSQVTKQLRSLKGASSVVSPASSADSNQLSTRVQVQEGEGKQFQQLLADTELGKDQEETVAHYEKPIADRFAEKNAKTLAEHLRPDKEMIAKLINSLDLEQTLQIPPDRTD